MRVDADVAQSVEQLIRNQQVGGSNPPVGSIKYKDFGYLYPKSFFILNPIRRNVNDRPQRGSEPFWSKVGKAKAAQCVDWCACRRLLKCCCSGKNS